VTNGERAVLVNKARVEVMRLIIDFQEEHGLTGIEMLQCVTAWQSNLLVYALRAERNDGNSKLEADLDHDDEDDDEDDDQDEEATDDVDDRTETVG